MPSVIKYTDLASSCSLVLVSNVFSGISHPFQLNRKVYLGLYDSRAWPEPDSRDEQRVRDYMVQKYENRRWYVAATDAMREEARRTNEAALTTGKQQSKTPLRWQLGEHAANKPAAIPPATSGVTVPLPGAVKTPFAAASSGGLAQPPSAPGKLAQPPVQPSAASNATTSSSSSGFDLLGDLRGDPFASSAGGSMTNHTGDAGGFADFSSFNSISSTTPAAPAPAPQMTPTAFPPLSTTPLQPLGFGQAPPTAASVPQPAASSTTASLTSNGGDRYAALADLDSAFSAPATTATSINWGGMTDATATAGGAGGLNWGATSSAAGGGVAWNSTSSAAPAGAGSGQINWNSQPGLGTVPASSTFAVPAPGKPGNPFLSSMPAANPFSASAGVPGGMSPFSTPAAPASSVNPFGGSMAASQFSQAGGQGMMPAASVAGGQFASPFAAQTASVGGGFAQFPPMQNGTGSGSMFGMPATSAFGSQGAGFPGQPQPQQQQFMMPAQQLGGWGQMGAPAQQPMANPFMNAAATMQNQVPPPSGSSNPFL
ncbi:ARF-GAP domain and FG repeat-containing protein 1-like [Elysia marginata]|uniref:ARF-GAP domain and FG repeat-containing protein 1-like n=1 Tax=Elysia marginata TaxID=1093978 RepID=A0AAV4FPE2_9GAST|nr:ARF-GAP domain and FG repeat-containing protein 1-like [Elysia marginata]